MFLIPSQHLTFSACWRDGAVADRQSCHAGPIPAVKSRNEENDERPGKLLAAMICFTPAKRLFK
jgi:hypothetical protein